MSDYQRIELITGTARRKAAGMGGGFEDGYVFISICYAVEYPPVCVDCSQRQSRRPWRPGSFASGFP
jgi:hypothetical protein